MSGPVVLVVAFAVMEGVSYAAHRWVMHGAGMGWHRSHHVPSDGGWERNDLFPACFSVVGFAVFEVRRSAKQVLEEAEAVTAE